jgi:hypothetical protein
MKKIRAILCLFLAAALLFAACSQDSDDDSPPELTIDGEDDLMKIGSEYPLNGKYTLTSDITLSNWTPIGGQQPFTGTFDGGGHTIRLSGFSDPAAFPSFVYTYNWAPEEGTFRFWVVPVGLFGHTNGAVVKNFTLNITAGSITLPAITKPVLDADAQYYTGGVAGLAENTTIEDIDIIVDGSLTITGSNEVLWGGVTGWAPGSNAKILNCVSNADISVSGSGYSAVGGIAGEIAYSGTIEDCRATGSVSAASSNDRARAGGIAAKNHGGGTITRSSSTGTVSATGTDDGTTAGGIVGENEHDGAVITYCFATGSVSASGSSGSVYAGGLIGANRTDTAGTVSHCYATGNVSATGSAANKNAGGLMGENNPHDSSISVSYCYASGTVSATGDGSNSAAGISPHNSGATSITSCVALNPSVPAGNRIGSAATLTNNYGLQTMSGGSWSNNASGSDGADVTAENAQDRTWWETTWNAKFGNSESAPWKWDGGSNSPKLWWE